MSFADVAALTIHDVKNRLAHLAGRAEARGDLETLRISMEASAALTHLLVFYKSENGILGLLINAHSPSDLLKELANEARGLGTIHVELDCSEAPTLWFYDETLVRMILSNAVNNGLRYARQNIRLVAAEREGYLEFTVHDDGLGYPESVLADEGASASVTEDGTGLGLRLAKRIAEMHQEGGSQGGTRLANENGAIFRLRLPK